jgi:ribosomal protein S18 acetylase RimI-like enzyme
VADLGVVLRPLRDADREAVAAVWHESAGLPGVGPPVMPAAAELRRRLDEGLSEGWAITVAAQGPEVVGFVAVRPREAILQELFVRPGLIGAGIGRALLEHAMSAMPEGFTLYTRSANARGRRFYERAGLVFLRTGTHPRTGDPIACYGWHRS